MSHLISVAVSHSASHIEKKPRIDVKDGNQAGIQPAFQLPSLSAGAVQCTKSAVQEITGVAPVPSQFLSKLAQVKSQASQSPVLEAVARTSAFSDTIRPRGPTGTFSPLDDTGLKRDDRLALVEELERGPYEFTPPSGDPDFLQLEPHSGIRLS